MSLCMRSSVLWELKIPECLEQLEQLGKVALPFNRSHLIGLEGSTFRHSKSYSIT